MQFLVLTQTNTFIIGPVAKLLGYIMQGIFFVTQNIFGFTNIGVAIIIFTVIMKLIMLPMTISQQKFSKMSSIMNPELQAITKKYKGKQDNESLLKQNKETKEVYQKYGVKPSAGCLPLLIQFPILFALYRVVYNIPAYVPSIKNIYMVIVEQLKTIAGYDTNEGLIALATSNSIKAGDLLTDNKLIDMMYNFDGKEWTKFTELFPTIKDAITGSIHSIEKMNSFIGGLSLSMQPSTYLLNAKDYGIITVIIAVAIPILAGASQFISSKISMGANSNQTQPQAEGTAGAMMQSMKMMTTVMPIMSIVFCFMFPAVIGIYWVLSSVLTIFTQMFVNSYMKKIDVNELVKKNMEKANEKLIKQGLPPQKISNIASTQVKNIEAPKSKEEIERENQNKQAKMKKATEYYQQADINPNSLAAKAGMVKKYNEKNNIKK